MTLRHDARHAGPRPDTASADRQRRLVLAALTHSCGFRTAQQLHPELRQAGHTVGLTTVYRTLVSLTDSGPSTSSAATAANACTGAATSSDTTTNHLLCRICGVAWPVQSVHVERWAQDTAAQHGFGIGVIWNEIRR